MTRSSRYARRVRTFALVSAFLAAAALAQGSWLDPIRELDGRGQTREALARLESEPQRLAADTGARLLRGVLLAKLGRTDEARELYQRLILEQPGLPEAYNNLAVMHAAAGDYDTAIEILKQGLGTHPSYRTTYDNLTKVYGKLAGEAYSKALGDERIDAEPLRLALINGVAQAPVPLAGGAPGPPPAAAPAGKAPQPLVPAPAPARPAATAPTGSGPTGSGPAASGPGASEPGASGPGDDARVARQAWAAVQAWADAWAGQRPDDYLAAYAPGFVPPGGGSRSEWEALRRRRLSAPEFIRISLAQLGVERQGEDRVLVRFVQSYESDRFRDTVTKALELVWSGAGWRIAAERVEDGAGG